MANDDENNRKIKNNSNIIFRQELKMITPKCNLKCALICNILVMIILFILGISILVTSSNIIKYEIDYTKW
jgi:hypothetical protein